MDADRAARFETVAADLVEPLRRFLRRRTDPDTAEEALSEALVVCWRRVDELPDPPLPWAYAVARLCLANAERAARRRGRLRARLSAVDPPRAPAPAVTGAEEARLADALGRLRADDAEVLRLWAWEQLTPAEIGTVLGLSANAAGVRLHRARGRLREEFAATGKDGAAAGHDLTREGRTP